jgi:hypothetical protein
MGQVIAVDNTCYWELLGELASVTGLTGVTKQISRSSPTAIVRTVGLALPNVEATTKYDRSPVLRVDGIFMAGLAAHPSAEPETLVVRAGLEKRERLVEDVPETH